MPEHKIGAAHRSIKIR